ncbi:MAG: MamI family restriction endonuclease [Planctomycetes bacterium]|nr:MamI family restriction endonuclease [Planctomycetota bacterium]
MTSPTPAKTIGVGTPENAEALLMDLYVRLRRDLQRWAAVTRQTPQPRMGYVGQHLVSVVTGHPGGRSGARGDDLKLPENKVAEIKCCYRVDQLGNCGACGTVVASIEKVCPNAACGSTNLNRKDDSKWLLSPKNEQELRELFNPVSYYFVLFEFADLEKGEDIDVFIYEVDPKCLGFSLCMIDYFFNIRPNSLSKAPFNMWPHSAKFCMMKPKMIYWSVILDNDTIDTRVFPTRDKPVLYALEELTEYADSDTITENAINAVAIARRIKFPNARQLPTANGKRRRAKLEILQQQRVLNKWSDEELADDFARAAFAGVAKYKKWITEFAPAL